MSRQLILFILVGTLAAVTHWGIVIAVVPLIALAVLTFLAGRLWALRRT